MSIFFEDIAVGDQIPAFTRKTTMMEWSRFAAVNEEFVYVHMDDEAGRAAGQPGAFGMGNLRWAYMLNALRDWAGDESEIKELAMQFRAINQKDDILSAKATVVDKSVADDGSNLIHLQIDVENQDGKGTSPGRAIVAVPSRA
ncbi:MaoC/PaaZ C-terminal domain-containing protein [Sphingobium chlorophenolicum]|uniref:Dehydratase n=1 Tax=Sphingobium chlorophenolicum TaxID=46429 RepID=A0A081R9V7_SPHCR|nr:MaoC/PaaZ C-terminal domain-containing protein [Sphingobium chlorophenolicum]KEQ51980.1 Dehydratase [Sphingobium chlorophenolicum]